METKDNETKTKGTNLGCCNSENFKEMFEKMGKCCPGQGDSFDFSDMKDAMMKKMMQMCCGPMATDTKGYADSQNK